MTIYITRYILTHGFIQVEIQKGEFEDKGAFYFGRVMKGFVDAIYFKNIDAFENKLAAISDCETRLIKKINAIEKKAQKFQSDSKEYIKCQKAIKTWLNKIDKVKALAK